MVTMAEVNDEGSSRRGLVVGGHELGYGRYLKAVLETSQNRGRRSTMPLYFVSINYDYIS